MGRSKANETKTNAKTKQSPPEDNTATQCAQKPEGSKEMKRKSSEMDFSPPGIPLKRQSSLPDLFEKKTNYDNGERDY